MNTDDDFDFPEGVLAYEHYDKLQVARNILADKGIKDFELQHEIIALVMRRVKAGEDVFQVTNEEIKRVKNK